MDELKPETKKAPGVPKPPTGIAGKVIRDGKKVQLIFKVGNVYFPHTEHNGELIDAYLHTGDENYLDQLEGEA